MPTCALCTHSHSQEYALFVLYYDALCTTMIATDKPKTGVAITLFSVLNSSPCLLGFFAAHH